MEYGPTLDIGDLSEPLEVSEDIDGSHETQEIWGRLFPLGKGWIGIDFVENEYTFGRSEDCDYCFEKNGGRTNPQFRTFSNTHFRIYKEEDKSDSQKYVVFLQDKSTNGTFVNGEKVGRNKKLVLNHDDEISLSLNKNKVFIFNDKGMSDNRNEKLPEEFKSKYTLSKQIGKGACGVVKLAFEKETCKRFAVKIISKKTFSVGPHLGSRSAIEEAKIIKSIQHPCIIRVEDLFDTSNTLYIVLELIEGGELFDRVISVGKFTEPTAKFLFYQILTAVKYLHDRGITHRDLKPENILLSTDDNETLIKVTDFGLSKFVGEQSLMQTLCGTPSYLAPEVIKSAGLGGYNKAVDCWSLGVILYIMLGGYPPFSDEIKEYTLQDQICNARYSFPEKYWKDISKDATDLISKLLTIDSTERITTTEALEHTWLKDNDVINKAEKLMNEEINQRMMPPPSLPGHKRSNCEEDNPLISNVKRPHLDTPPPPHSNEDNNSDNTSCSTVIRTTSIASTLSTQSSNGHST